MILIYLDYLLQRPLNEVSLEEGLDGTTSSPLISIDILLTDQVLVKADPVEESFDFVVYGSVFAAVILSIVLLIAFMKNESSKEAIHARDSDIEEVVEAEIIE